MLKTLYEIPITIQGVPLFGLTGLLLGLWGVVAAVYAFRLLRRQGFGGDTVFTLILMAVIAAVIVFLPRMFPYGLPIRGYGAMMLLGVVSGVGLAVWRAKRMGVDPEIIFSLAFWIFVAGIFGARLFYVIEYWDHYREQDNLLAAIVNVSQGGLVVYGSLIAVLIAMFVFVKKYNIPGLALADLVAPSMALGLAFGRIGCLLNGCCFGGSCDLPWAVEFPWDSPPHLRQVETGQIHLHGIWLDVKQPNGLAVVKKVEPDSPAAKAGLKSGDRLTRIDSTVLRRNAGGELVDQRLQFNLAEAAKKDVDNHSSPLAEAQSILLESRGVGKKIDLFTTNTKVPNYTMTLEIPRERSQPSPHYINKIHPTQIYSSINAFLICLFLLAYYPFRRRDGEVVAMLLTIYAITRFLLEIIRTDEAAVFQTNLSISQNVSIMFAIGLVALWIFILTRPKKLAWLSQP